MASPGSRPYAATLRWTEVQFNGCTPENRWGAAQCVVDETRLFFCGGCYHPGNSQGSYKYFADAWYITKDETGFKWEKLPPPPDTFKPRHEHTATLIGDHIWIIGGQGRMETFDEVFTFNIRTLEWKKQSVRIPAYVRRSGHIAIQMPNDQHRILLFGGHCKGGQPNTAPTLVTMDTKLLTTTELHTLGDVKLSRMFAQGFLISDSKIFFAGGMSVEKKIPLEGAACLELDHRRWREKYTSEPALRSLVGARGVRYQNKIYLHGGRHSDRTVASLTSDVIEIGCGRLPPHCDTRLIRSEGLPAMSDHLLFMDGDWLYALGGRTEPMWSDTKVYRASLASLQRERLSVPLETTDLTNSFEEIPDAMVMSPTTTPRGSERAEDPRLQATRHFTSPPREPIEPSDVYRVINAEIKQVNCEPIMVQQEGDMGMRLSFETVISLRDNQSKESMQNLLNELTKLKDELATASSTNARLEAKMQLMSDTQKNTEALLTQKEQEVQRLNEALNEVKSELSVTNNRMREWFQSSPFPIKW